VTAPPADAPTSGQVLGRASGENFPVASVLFPRAVRPHLMALYGFARLADDVGDEAPGDRDILLDWLSAELEEAFDGSPQHPLMQRVAVTIRRFDLPAGPFERLIEANRVDQRVTRYDTFQDLLGYCRLSANPVGELVLSILGAAIPDRLALSDATCTGLQLVEFWQDLGEDARRGRVYVPLEDLDRFGYPVEDLLAGVRDERFLGLMRFQATRSRRLLERGRRLGATIPGRAGLAVRLFTAGGLAALSDLERRGFDTFGRSGRASGLRRATWALAELTGVRRRTAADPAPAEWETA
jgi:squalene synthase HpnC